MASRTVAVIGDTHDIVVGREVVNDLLAPVLSGAHLILHTGDVSTVEMLDALEQVAPIHAVRSETDPSLPPRLVDGPTRVELDGCRIELNRVLEADALVERDDVDVVVHGGTHSPSVEVVGRTIYLNPGAPVLTPRPSGARLVIDDGGITATIVFLDIRGEDG